MPVTPNFRTFVADQLAPLRDVVFKRMFGGVGLYRDGKFFGLIDDDIVYLRVDDATRPEYVKRGLPPFRPVRSQPNKVSLNYYQVPDDVLEDSVQLVQWAKRALIAASSKTAGELRKVREKAKRSGKKAR